MSKIYLTSDWHLNHARILEFEPESRPFETVAEMNKKIIKNYNDMAENDSITYLLGDFILGSGDNVESIISQLRTGTIKIIPGNHDTPTKLATYEKLGIEVLPQLYDLKAGKWNFALCHYPLASWRSQGHNGLHAFGHVHSMEKAHRETPFNYRWDSIHIGVDEHNLKMWSIEEAIENCLKRKGD